MLYVIYVYIVGVVLYYVLYAICIYMGGVVLYYVGCHVVYMLWGHWHVYIVGASWRGVLCGGQCFVGGVGVGVYCVHGGVYILRGLGGVCRVRPICLGKLFCPY